MSTKLLAVVMVAFGCVGVAAGAAYLALHTNSSDLSATSAAEPAVIVDAPAAPAQAAEPAASAAVAPEPEPIEKPAAVDPVLHPTLRSTIPQARAAQEVAPAGAPTATDALSAIPQTAKAVAPPDAAAPPATPVETPVTPPAQVTQEVTKPQYQELTVAADSVIGIRLDSTISTETAKIEDAVNARVSRDVLVDGRTAIPAGARLEGTITAVDRGGKFKERARLGLRFNALILADGTRTPIDTETIYREGDSPTGQAAAKVGGSAVVGAILGGLLGGKKGAIAGSAVGAAGGAAAVAKGDRAETVLTSGLMLTVRLTAPVTVTVERDNE